MGDFVEDVRGIPKRAASISSCSSDPLEYRHRGGLRSATSSMYGGSDEGSDDHLDTKSCGGESAASGVASQRTGGGGGGRDRRFHAMEPIDIQEWATDLLQKPSTIAETDDTATPAPGSSDALPPLEAISIDHVSEAPVAIIDAVIVSSSTVVANKRQDALVVDVGTRICLADGTVVGVVATVLGPVASCAYAVACRPSAIADLALEDRLNEGTFLHYDVTKQSVLYDPTSQCDSGKGTDASFVQDDELPLGSRPDFSDDEDERAWKRRRREAASGGHVVSTTSAGGASSSTAKIVAQGTPQQQKLRHAAAAPVAAAPTLPADVMADISSSDSEVEFDDEGNMVAYRPRRRKRGL